MAEIEIRRNDRALMLAARRLNDEVRAAAPGYPIELHVSHLLQAAVAPLRADKVDPATVFTGLGFGVGVLLSTCEVHDLDRMLEAFCATVAEAHKRSRTAIATGRGGHIVVSADLDASKLN